MVTGSVKLSFKQTKAEFMVRVASTLLFNKLVKANTRIVTVREITENVQYGYTEKASESEIGPKYVRITDLKDGRVNWETVPYCKCDNPEQYLLKKNDLIFARTGATTGKTHLFRETRLYAVFASYLIRVRPTKEINPEYLYFFFQSDLYWSQVSGHKEGSAQPNVNGQKLSNIELPIADEETQNAICKFLAVVRARQDGFAQELPELPYPLIEQRQIVERVEALAVRVTKVQSLREDTARETKFLSQSVLREIFSQKGGWEVKTLDKVAPINMGQSPIGNSYNFDKDGSPLLNGPTEFGERHPTPRQWTTSPTKFCKAGDILICVRGATTGKMNWADQEYCIGRGLAALSVDKTKCIPEYVYYFVQTQTQEILSRTAGSTFPNLPGEKLKTLPIPVPPLDEQRRIVAYLDSVQARLASLRELQSATGEELSALLPSVLDRAFKGEL